MLSFLPGLISMKEFQKSFIRPLQRYLHSSTEQIRKLERGEIGINLFW
ncbi:hypothetical protein KIS4809_0934 [Bacillus sp. ZZV12-4809]|nr:hypothetical protein KIS4809_0934 [Bacillus sp. ZZV12-4809]